MDKPVVEIPKDTQSTPLETQTRQELIFGMLDTGSSVPTDVPKTLVRQLRGYHSGSTDRLYWYDKENNAWRTPSSSGGGGAKSVTFVVGPASNSDSSTYDYTTDGTDDDVQIQAAIDALPSTGGEVKLREGTYTLGSASVVVAKNGVALSGVGAGTIVTCKTNFNNKFLKLGHASNSYSNTIIRDIYFDGNQANQSTSSGIQIIDNEGLSVDIANVLIYNCWFINIKRTAIINNGAGLIINRCYFSEWTANAGNYCIQAVDDTLVINSYFTNTSTTASCVQGGLCLENNFVLANSYTGLMVLVTSFAGNKVNGGSSLNPSSGLIQSTFCNSNYFSFGNSFAGVCIYGSYKACDNFLTFGTVDSTAKGISLVENCVGNTIVSSTANVASVAIHNCKVITGNKTSGFGNSVFLETYTSAITGNTFASSSADFIKISSGGIHSGGLTTVTGNSLEGAPSANDTYSGVLLTGGSTGYCSITGNVILCPASGFGNRIKYGVRENSATDGPNTVTGNTVPEYTTAGISLQHGSSINANNLV